MAIRYNSRMHHTTTRKPSAATIARMSAVRTEAENRFRTLLCDATPESIRMAGDWYNEAGAFAAMLSNNATAWSLEVSACVISAFSPRVTWSLNKRKAMQYSYGLRPAGLRSALDTADRCVREGFNGLRGPKTNAFARAIAGDKDAVVIDIWMCRAAGLTYGERSKYAGQPKDAPSAVEYRAIADAVRIIAADWDMPAADMQALLWILARGKAE